jgi:hypothetical protein
VKVRIYSMNIVELNSLTEENFHEFVISMRESDDMEFSGPVQLHPELNSEMVTLHS